MATTSRSADRPVGDADADQSGPAAAGRAARGTAFNLLGSGVGAVIGVVTIGLVTNHWGRSGAGLFFATTALFTLAANGARMGSEAGLTYFVARLRADDDHRSVPRVIGTALAATGAVAMVLAIAGFVLAPRLAELVASEAASRPDAETMVRILAVAVPTFALSQAMFGASRGFATMRPSVICGQLLRPAAQLVFVVAVILTTGSLPTLALAWAGSSVLTVTAIGWWLRRRVAQIRVNHPEPASEGLRGRYLRFAWGRAGADLVSAALERLDVILVAALLGQADAGLYGASGRLILAGQLLMIAAAQSTAPLLTASFSAGRDREAQTLLRTVTGWNVTLLWPVFICLGFGAETALGIFGSEFADGAPLVVVLSVAMLAIVAIGGGDTVLVSTGASVASLANHVIALVVMIGSAAVLLPSVGLVGAAWAWALSRLTLRILAATHVWRQRRVNALGRPVFLAAGAATAAYGPIGVVALLVLGPGPLAVAGQVIVGAAIHLFLLSKVRVELDLDRFIAVFARRANRAAAGSPPGPPAGSQD
ncbi:MAG: oligosaccharide flippase family protein [Actinomycetota bacterium]